MDVENYLKEKLYFFKKREHVDKTNQITSFSFNLSNHDPDYGINDYFYSEIIKNMANIREQLNNELKIKVLEFCFYLPLSLQESRTVLNRTYGVYFSSSIFEYLPDILSNTFKNISAKPVLSVDEPLFFDFLFCIPIYGIELLAYASPFILFLYLHYDANLIDFNQISLMCNNIKKNLIKKEQHNKQLFECGEYLLCHSISISCFLQEFESQGLLKEISGTELIYKIRFFLNEKIIDSCQVFGLI